MKVTAAPGVLLLFVYVSAPEHLNLNIFAYALIYYFKKQQYPLFPRRTLVSRPNGEPLLFVLTCQLR